MIAATVTLYFWIVGLTPPIPFGPFGTPTQCESTFSQVSGYYLGPHKLEHLCKEKADKRD
jgi:hypothetical protein